MVSELDKGTRETLTGILDHPPIPIEGFGSGFDWIHACLREAKFFTRNVASGEERVGQLLVRAMRHNAEGNLQEIELSIIDPLLSPDHLHGDNIRLVAMTTKNTGRIEIEIFSGTCTHEEIRSESFAQKLRENLVRACLVVKEL